MHSYKEIIDNQETYKKEIINYFNEDVKELKEIIRQINSKDPYIQKEKKKLERKVKKTKYRNYLDKFFFMNSKRSKKYYVWWDDKQKEAFILKYAR